MIQRSNELSLNPFSDRKMVPRGRPEDLICLGTEIARRRMWDN